MKGDTCVLLGAKGLIIWPIGLKPLSDLPAVRGEGMAGAAPGHDLLSHVAAKMAISNHLIIATFCSYANKHRIVLTSNTVCK